MLGERCVALWSMSSGARYYCSEIEWCPAAKDGSVDTASVTMLARSGWSGECMLSGEVV